MENKLFRQKVMSISWDHWQLVNVHCLPWSNIIYILYMPTSYVFQTHWNILQIISFFFYLDNCHENIFHSFLNYKEIFSFLLPFSFIICKSFNLVMYLNLKKRKNIRHKSPRFPSKTCVSSLTFKTNVS